MEVTIAIGIIAAAVIGFLCWTVRNMSRDMREVATEAILASKASSAEDLSQAANFAHWSKLERENIKISSKATPKPEPQSDPNKYTLPNGTVLDVLTPFR